MGQKNNPIGLRLFTGAEFGSIWYDNKGYADKLHQDLKIKKMVKVSLANAGVSKVVIKRSSNTKVVVEIRASKPGAVIGKRGVDIDSLKARIEKIANCEVSVNIQEIRRPEIDSYLVAQNIAQQLEKRVAFRRAAKRAVQSAMKLGAQGIKILISGRLGGAEIARSEKYREGRVPLHTLKADIDYAMAEALTTYGIIGIKVWVYKGEYDSASSSQKFKDLKSHG
jgi:small subunit ribosomal protein S3